MEKVRVLFVCVHNSARSQMAEELLRKMGAPYFDVESAGFEHGRLNPLVIEVLKEEGIDITGKQTKVVFDLYKKGNRYSHVITVCDESSAERCPLFPGIQERLHWSFSDPSRFTGNSEEKLAKIRDVRDQIKAVIKSWIPTVKI